MTRTQENIYLANAVQASESMGNTSYLWIVRQNILGLEVPQELEFDCISVGWFRFSAVFYVQAFFKSTTANIPSLVRPLEEDDTHFKSLEELKEVYPELFNVTGSFRVVTP